MSVNATRTPSATATIARSPPVKPTNRRAMVLLRDGGPSLPGEVDHVARHDRCVAPGAAVLGPFRCLLLVVLGLDVHRPDVVVGAEDVLDGEHGRVHRVVLVVVLV